MWGECWHRDRNVIVGQESCDPETHVPRRREERVVLGGQKEGVMGRRLPKEQLPPDDCPSGEGNTPGSWIACWAPHWLYPIRNLGAVECGAEAQIGQFPRHRAGAKGRIIDLEEAREVAQWQNQTPTD